MRRPQQVICIRLSLTGDIQIDFRYPPRSPAPSLEGETNIWAEVWQRRSPETALFVDGVCVYKGAFASVLDAETKLKVHRGSPRG